MQYLWPNFIPKALKGQNMKKSTDAHVISIVLMVNEKFRDRVSKVMDIFASDPSRFSALFLRVMNIMDSDKKGKHAISLQVRRFLLVFFINCFQSLENAMVRKECMRFVGPGTWCNLTERRREEELRRAPERREFWERAEARFQAIGDGKFLILAIAFLLAITDLMFSRFCVFR